MNQRHSKIHDSESLEKCGFRLRIHESVSQRGLTSATRTRVQTEKAGVAALGAWEGRGRGAPGGCSNSSDLARVMTL